MPQNRENNGENKKGDMFSRINVDKVRKLRPLKIDYSRVRKLEFIDKNNLKPQTFQEFTKIVTQKKLKVTEKTRPALRATFVTSRTFRSFGTFQRKCLF